MQTNTAQPAQNFPQSNGGFKFILSLVAGIFLFYAVQSHLVTDAFCGLLSLVFDNFSVKATGLLPDIFCLLLLALVLLGIWHLLQFYLAATVIILAVALIAAVMFADAAPAKHSNGLSLLSKFSSDKKGE